MHARYYSRAYHVPFLDAVQEGNFGLMHAIKRYSFERECKLSTYATWWIKQAITRWIMDTNRTIRLPVHVHDLLARSRKASVRLFKKLDREPTDEEICKELDISLKRFRTAQEGLKQVYSMDRALDESKDDGDLLGDTIPDDRPLQDELMHNQELSDNVIGPVIATLKPQQRFVIVMRFGLDGVIFPESEIAKAMKLEEKEIRALELSALQKLDPPKDILFERSAIESWMRRVSRSILTRQEDLVFILRYGIGAQENTLEQIAERVSMTRERIRQIEAKVLPLLRHRMDHGILRSEKNLGIHTLSDKRAVSAALV
jgi:RNA polymerase primary sigma factor